MANRGADRTGFSVLRALITSVLVALVLGVAASAAGFAAPAGARAASEAEAEDAPADQSIRGTVFNETLEDGQSLRTPVAGVTVEVVDADGTEIGRAETDKDGIYQIDLPAPGPYTLRIDEESLPKGVSAPEGSAERLVNVNPGQLLVGNFFLGEDTRVIASRWDRLPQSIFDGLYFGLVIAMAAVGLSLIYGTTGLSNFAHGEMVTFGAVMAWVANRTWGLHLLLAALMAIAFGVAGGYLFDRTVWRPLRARRIGLTSQMIASIGLAVFLRYLLQYLFGPRQESYAQYQNQTNPIDLGPVAFPPRTLAIIMVCLAVLGAMALFLLRTRFGKAVRAVSDNPDLASATGINTARVISLVWILGGALAALGGVLVGLDQKVAWDRGAGLLLLMFAAITLGGLGSAFAALVGSLVIGLSVELSAWLFADYIDLKRTGALVVLIVVLLARPQGILGTRERIG